MRTHVVHASVNETLANLFFQLVVPQRLVGYDTSTEGLGFTEPGHPASLLGEGGTAVLKAASETARATAVANYKRLLAHREVHVVELQAKADGEAVTLAQMSEEEVRAELQALESRTFAISQRIHELRKRLCGSAPAAATAKL